VREWPKERGKGNGVERQRGEVFTPENLRNVLTKKYERNKLPAREVQSDLILPYTPLCESARFAFSPLGRTSGDNGSKATE
jgi:hypothetical protein